MMLDKNHVTIIALVATAIALGKIEKAKRNTRGAE
jgi:hypothetical protein